MYRSGLGQGIQGLTLGTACMLRPNSRIGHDRLNTRYPRITTRHIASVEPFLSRHEKSDWLASSPPSRKPVIPGTILKLSGVYNLYSSVP